MILILKTKQSILKTKHSPSSISILIALYKEFEKIILQRLKEFTEMNNFINKEQFNFRKNHSTVHQLKMVVNTITENKNNRKSTGILFFDIEKAFDTLWHDGLIF